MNLHFHTLVLDGLFDAAADMRFRALPPPDDFEVERVAWRIARGLRPLLERRGLGPHDDPELIDPLAVEDPALAALYSASVRGKIAEGPRRGQQVLRFGDQVPVDALPGMAKATPRCATVAGLSLHANVAIPGRDRARIERLCRYAARPPLATERLERLADGRLIYRLRHRYRDGTTHVVFEPIDFVAKLAALVPPPRFHTVRYHGILAPAARRRAAVVPGGAPGGRRAHRIDHAGCGLQHADTECEEGPRRDSARKRRAADEPHARRYTWAELIKRVFQADAFECPRCHGRSRILAAIHPPETTVAILECLKLPTRAPPVAPPDAGEEAAFADFGA